MLNTVSVNDYRYGYIHCISACCLFTLIEVMSNLSDGSYGGNPPGEQPEQRRPIVLSTTTTNTSTTSTTITTTELRLNYA